MACLRFEYCKIINYLWNAKEHLMMHVFDFLIKDFENKSVIILYSRNVDGLVVQ